MTSYPDTKMKVVSYLLPISEAIKNKDDKKPIFFQFLPTISGDSRNANYDTPGGSPLGRAEQFHVYKSSGNKTLSLKTTFAATGESVSDFSGSLGQNNFSGGAATEVWVQRQVKRLQALAEPIYDRNDITQKTAFNAPPLVLLTHGLRYINVPVVVKSVSPEPASNAMIDGYGALPQVMEVTIELSTNYPYGFVPGYLNTIKLFDKEGNINAGEHNFDGVNNSNMGNIQDILIDSNSISSRILGSTRVNVKVKGE